MKKYLSNFFILAILLFTNNLFAAVNVSITGADSYYEDPNDKGAYIYLNDRVEDYKLKKHIRVIPSVGLYTFYYAYDSNRYRYKINGNFKSGKEYTIELIPGEIKGTNFNCVSSPIKFKAVGPQPKFQFMADRSVIELKSKQLIPMSLTNVGNFKSQLTNIPSLFTPTIENLCLMAEADEKRPMETEALKYRIKEKKLPIISEESINSLFDKLKKQYESAKSIDLPELKAFINADFETESKGYLGSEGSEKEMFFSLPLDFRKNPTKGGSVLALIGENGTKNAEDAVRLIQVTDLSISYKFSEKSLLLWVTSIETGTPIEGAEIMLYTLDSKRLFPGKTNKDGLLIVKENSEIPSIYLDNETTFTKGTEKFVMSDTIFAAAANDNDSSFVKLTTNRIYPANSFQTAIDNAKIAQFKGKVFTERGVYRPGETIFWKAVFRQYKDFNINSKISDTAIVKIRNANGEEISNASYTLNAFGSCSGSVELTKYSPLGQYYIEAFIPKKQSEKTSQNDSNWDFLMNRKPKLLQIFNRKDVIEQEGYCCTNVQVQEFEAPKHFGEITITPEKRIVSNIVGSEKEQDYIKCSISGKYYAGGILRHAKVRWSAYLTGESYRIKEYAGYIFGNENNTSNLIESGDSILNNDGIIEVGIPVSKNVLNGLNCINIKATILDVDGKSATVEKTYTAKTSCKLGLSDVIGPDENGQNSISAIVIDDNNNKINTGDISIELMMNKWFYVQKRGEDGKIYYNWTSSWQRALVINSSIKDGEAKFNIPAVNNKYMIKASYSNGSNQSISSRIYEPEGDFDGYADYNNTYRTSSGNQLVLTTDKNTVKVGEKVNVYCSMPKPTSYALITVETNELISTKVVKTNRGLNTFTVEMTENCRPNAYVSIFVPTLRSELPVYTSDIDADYPTVCYGYTKIDVKDNIQSIKTTIGNNEEKLKALPGETKTITFNVVDSEGKPVVAEMAVGIVDESVLALTDYVTPVLSVLKQFDAPLAVFSGDLRISLIAQDLFKLISTRALTGGGVGEGLVVPDKLREDFRPVAYWNPALVTDEFGKASIEVKFPDTMTSYRIYSIAADKESSFDTQERQIVVSKDFYVEPAEIPFLTAGDKTTIAANIHNLTNKSGNANINIAEASNISATLISQDIPVNAESNSIAKIVLEADKEAENAEIIVSASFDGMNDVIKRKIPVKSDKTMMKGNNSGAFTKEVKASTKSPMPEWVKGDLKSLVKARLSLSTGLWSKLEPAYNYIFNYNYGCCEQTSSKLMVLASLYGINDDKNPNGLSKNEINTLIDKNLNNLYLMQLGSGGFSYWKSSCYDSYWASQYAVFAMTMLDKKGYPINKERFKQSLAYTKEKLFKDNDKEQFKHGIYALAVVNLAMNNMLEESDINKLRTQFSAKDEEAVALLNLSEIYTNTIPLDNINAIASKLAPTKNSVIRGWQTSSIRTDAIKLMYCNIANGKSAAKAADNIAGSILKQMKAYGYWGSTADTSFALTALTEYANKQNSSNTKTVKVKINGATIRELDINEKNTIVELTPDELINGVTISAENNKALVHWNLTYEYPENPENKGSISNGFIVQKTLENTSGKQEIKTGDIVKVTVIFEDKFADDLDWVTMTDLYVEDPIPAGFATINTSLKNESLPSDIEEDEEKYYYEEINGSYPFYADHEEMHKDRLTVFKNRAWSGRFRIEYYLRAAYPGTFTMKPTQIGLMYEPEIYGRSESKSITISE